MAGEKGGLRQMFSQNPVYRRSELPTAEPWMTAAEKYATQLGIDPMAAKALLFAESAGGYKTSNKGAKGPWQLVGKSSSPNSPEDATASALGYFKELLNRFGGDYNNAVAAYNWGPTNVSQNMVDNAIPVDKLPTETKRHLSRFWEYYQD